MTPFNFAPQTAASVNFFQKDPESSIDVNALQRQRAMAQLLAQRGIQAQDGQMVGGHYVAPSALGYVNQLASALLGERMNREADAKEQSLAQALIAKRQKDSTDFMSALNGTPAQPGREIAPLTPNDDEGNPMPSAQAPATAAVPGDVNKAIAIALQSQNPALAGMAPDLIKRQMGEKQLSDIMSRYGGGGAGGTSGAPGVNPLAMALISSGNPAFEKLGGVVQDASKPIALREGDLVVPDGQGGFKAAYSQPKLPAGMVPTRDATGKVTGASVLPNFAAGNASIAGQEEGARQGAQSENAMVTVDVNGKPRQMTRAQFLKLSNDSQAPLPSAQPGMTGNFSGNENDILAGINNIRDPQERANALAAYAQQQQAARSTPPGIAAQGEGEKKYNVTRAEDFAKRASAIQSAGSSSSGMLRNLDTLEQFFKDPNVAKGGAAESISGLKNTAASMGVDIKGVGSEQAIMAITNKMALDSRSTAEGGGMPGAMSDADRNFLSNQQPGLNKTPEGRAMIIENSRKLAQRNIEVARMAQRYEQQHGQIDAGFDRQLQEFADKNPMFGNSKAPAAPQAPDIRSLAAQELARRKRGN